MDPRKFVSVASVQKQTDSLDTLYTASSPAPLSLSRHIFFEKNFTWSRAAAWKRRSYCEEEEGEKGGREKTWRG